MKVNLPKGYERIELPFYDEWIEALESGEYKQGIGELTLPDGCYCCLGVLSKIQGRLTPFMAYQHRDGGSDGPTRVLADSNPCYPVLCDSGMFPEGVTVSHSNGKNAFRAVSLMELNDRGATFNQIATVIKTIWKPVSS